MHSEITQAALIEACTINDRFDFDTSSNSRIKNLISGLAARLFTEFNWESTVSFDLTVPHDDCSHSLGAYRWTYDADSKSFSADVTDGYEENPTTKIQTTSDSTSYYHALSEPVRLYHDRPWVLEYDVKNAGNIPLFSTPGISIIHPGLIYSTDGTLCFWVRERFYISE